MTRGEVMDLLGVNNDRMKYLTKNGKLDAELCLHGYSISKTYKIGRNSVYDLKQVAIDEWDQYQSYRNIRKKTEHTTYVESRLTTGGMKKPRKSFIKELKSDISPDTAKRYDDMLVEDEVMIKDKAVYMLFDTNNETFQEISKEEYKQFWGDLGELKEQLAINKQRYNRHEITENTYDSNKTVWMTALGKEKGVIALKYDTYKEYTNTVRVLDMIKKHKARIN